jgi:hypothetical protein
VAKPKKFINTYEDVINNINKNHITTTTLTAKRKRKEKEEERTHTLPVIEYRRR